MLTEGGSHGSLRSIDTQRCLVPVTALPRLNPNYRKRTQVVVGATVKDIVCDVLPEHARHSARVFIGADLVPHDRWALIRPKAGTLVIVRAVPEGDTGRTLLSLAVVVAATLVAGPFGLGAALSSATGGLLSAATFTSLTSLALATAGVFLVNAFIPVRPSVTSSTDTSRGSPSYEAQGWQNVANPGGVIPSIFGVMRYSPQYASYPYTSEANGYQYVTGLFLLGHGEVDIADIRLGDTSLSNFDEVQLDIKYGAAGDGQQGLYPKEVLEERPQLEFPGTLTSATSIVKTTADRADEVSVTVTFPNGLCSYDATGNIAQWGVELTIEYRLAGSGDPFVYAFDSTIYKTTNEAFHQEYHFQVPTSDQYEIRVTRVSASANRIDVVDSFVWSSLRTIRNSYPINMEPSKPLAVIGIRVRAGEKLNGIIANLNCIVARKIPDFVPSQNLWNTQITSNPASVFRQVLQGAENAYPFSDAEVDLRGLEDWWTYCNTNGLAYNRVHDFSASLWDVLQDVAAAGHASPRHDGTKWGVVIDQAQGSISAHITPRNSWGLSIERPHLRLPQAFRCSFIDETNNYEHAERIVPFPDFYGEAEDAEITEELNLPGITDPDLVYAHARRRALEVSSRRDRYTINMDIENLVVTRGDLVLLSHDALDRTQFAGRVKDVYSTTSPAADWVVLDVVVDFNVGESYAARFRQSDGSSLLKAVLTITIQDNQTYLTVDSGTQPEVGDLAMFGVANSESRGLIVTSIEMADNLTARLTLVDAAEDIYDIGDIPVWVPVTTPTGGSILPPALLDDVSAELLYPPVVAGS